MLDQCWSTVYDAGFIDPILGTGRYSVFAGLPVTWPDIGVYLAQKETQQIKNKQISLFRVILSKPFDWLK